MDYDSSCGTACYSHSIQPVSYTHLDVYKRQDMLNVVYTVAPYVYANTSDTRMELMDSYLRLDREIAKLLNMVESTAGRQNSVVWVAGVPASPSSRRDDEKWGIPFGQI